MRYRLVNFILFAFFLNWDFCFLLHFYRVLIMKAAVISEEMTLNKYLKMLWKLVNIKVTIILTLV